MLRALNTSGVVDSLFTGNVSVGVTSGTAVLSGTTTVSAVGGVATFSNLVLTGSDGANTLTFTSTGLTSTAASSISLASRAAAIPLVTLVQSLIEVVKYQSDSISPNLVVPIGRIVSSVVSSGTGSVVILDGKISYTPRLGFKGVDTFEYNYLDPLGESKLVSVQVIVPNQAPTVNPVINPLTPDGNFSVSLNASDPNGDRLKVRLGTPTKDVRVFLVRDSIKFLIPKDFSGEIAVPISVTDSDGAVTNTTSQVVINPRGISGGKLMITSSLKEVAINQNVALQQILLVKLPLNAIGYELYVNGKLTSIGSSSEVLIEKLIGPRDVVELVSIGNEGTRSSSTPVTFIRNPISIANVNFAFDSFGLTPTAQRLLKSVAKKVVQHGFTRIDLSGFVDSMGSRSYGVQLSQARATIVKDYMALQLVGSQVAIDSIGLGALRAAGDNKTNSGRALNRRVEIKVS